VGGRRDVSGFDHFAVVYESDEEFVARVLPFVNEGLAADGAVMVAVDPRKIELLEERLGADAAKVRFEDMRTMGRNPGAIISAWQEFAEAHAGRALWGVGEPAWPGRSAAEFEECRHHECLLNAAFGDAENFRLLCPYDGRSLGLSVLERVFESHPSVVTPDGVRTSDCCVAPEDLADLLAESLPAPPSRAAVLDFDLSCLHELRRVVRVLAADAGIDDDATEEFVLAVNELAENSIRYGSGGGRLRLWAESDCLVADVSDRGRLDDPLVGRRRPAGSREGGYGVWLTHQVCDLVQVRSSERGTTVRAHMRVPAAA
jgi:anti-sigma regulatory factor (Ser/Thr protein kinase)